MAAPIPKHRAHTPQSTPRFDPAQQFKLLRDISGQQFADAIDEALGPRMKITGERMGWWMGDDCKWSYRHLPCLD